MTREPDPYVVVVTSNSDLAAALPFHCTLRVEYEVAMALGAAVIVIDQRPGRSVQEELDRLGGVTLERVIVISNEDHSTSVAATITRPVAVSELCRQVDRVASGSGALMAEPTSPPLAADDPEQLAAVAEPAPSEHFAATDEAESSDGAGAFFREVDQATRAARAALALLSRHPTLRDPDGLIAAVAEEALQNLPASMLGLWRRGPSAELDLLGGVGLRPTDRQRELTALHPLVAAALDEGGLLITSVSDEPSRVAGLPGAYCESLVLLPLDLGKDLSMMVVAAGDGFDQDAFSQIEGRLMESTSLLDWAATLQRLRVTLDV